MKSYEALYLTGEILEELMDEIEEYREDGIDLESGMEERARALREVLQMAKKFDDRNREEDRNRDRFVYTDRHGTTMNLEETQSEELLSKFILGSQGIEINPALIGCFVNRGSGELEDVEEMVDQRDFETLYDVFNEEKIKEYMFYTIVKDERTNNG